VSASQAGWGFPSRPRTRALRLVAAVLLVAAGAAGLAACSPSGDGSGGNGKAPEAELILWLDLSRSELDGHAGYGYIAPSDLLKPYLYWTHGALEIMEALSYPVEGSEAVKSWVMTLRSESGLFDDPSSNAPDLLETYWALRSLRLLGMDPESLPHIAESLLIRMPSVQTTSCTLDPQTVDRLSGAMLLAKCLREITEEHVAGRLPQASALRALAARVLQDQDGALRSSPPWEQSTEFDGIWLACRIMSLVDPGGLTPAAISFLVTQALHLEDAPAGFHGVAMIADLIEMIGSLAGEEDMLQRLIEDTRVYLATRILPGLGAVGGFEVTNSTGGRYPDPQMNAVLVRLCVAVDVDYPHAGLLISETNRSRLAAGWGPRILCPHDPELTYEALLIMTHAGVAIREPEKVSAYLWSVLSSEGSLRDTLAAARGLALLGEDSGTIRTQALAAVREKTSVDLLMDSEWLVDFLYHLDIDPDTPALAHAVDVRMREMFEHIGETSSPRMFALHEIALLGCVLGESPLSREELVAAILELESETGGFRAISFSPVADIFSTREAVEALVALDSTDLIPARGCLSFVAACRLSPGYALGVPSELRALGDLVEADLHTTAEAVSIMQLLGMGSFYSPVSD
jgi:prenyltransferase beta subunit